MAECKKNIQIKKKASVGFSRTPSTSSRSVASSVLTTPQRRARTSTKASCKKQQQRPVSTFNCQSYSNNYGSARITGGGPLVLCSIMQCTGLLSIVTQPTRSVSYLDRIYVSCPIYTSVRAVKSLVRSDHNAVVAYVDRPQLTNKTREGVGDGTVRKSEGEFL